MEKFKNITIIKMITAPINKYHFRILFHFGRSVWFLGIKNQWPVFDCVKIYLMYTLYLF